MRGARFFAPRPDWTAKWVTVARKMHATVASNHAGKVPVLSLTPMLALDPSLAYVAVHSAGKRPSLRHVFP